MKKFLALLLVLTLCVPFAALAEENLYVNDTLKLNLQLPETMTAMDLGEMGMMYVDMTTGDTLMIVTMPMEAKSMLPMLTVDSLVEILSSQGFENLECLDYYSDIESENPVVAAAFSVTISGIDMLYVVYYYADTAGNYVNILYGTVDFTLESGAWFVAAMDAMFPQMAQTE